MWVVLVIVGMVIFFLIVVGWYLGKWFGDFVVMLVLNVLGVLLVFC